MDGKRLVELRRKARLTQVELAVKSKVAAATITNIERGAPVNPQLSTLEALAKALDATVAELLAGPQKEAAKTA